MERAGDAGQVNSDWFNMVLYSFWRLPHTKALNTNMLKGKTHLNIILYILKNNKLEDNICSKISLKSGVNWSEPVPRMDMR